MYKMFEKNKIIIFLGVLIVGGIIVFSTLQYPKKMKKMFVESSVQSMENKLNDAAAYTNENVSMNYAEIKLLAGLVSKYLDGSDEISSGALDIMEETRKKEGFDKIGICKMGSGHLFATLSDGKQVQLDVWTIDLEMELDKVSVELQTSPFQTINEGSDMVVYRYSFMLPTGEQYIIIAEKSQNTLNGILNLTQNDDEMIFVIRDNGNIVYAKGDQDVENTSSYHFYSYIEKLGATEKEVEEIEKEIEKNNYGKFVLDIGKEPYYFIFHKIEDTNWICIKGYSESKLAGTNLEIVNTETMKLVVTVVVILIISLIISLFVTMSNMRKKSQKLLLDREMLFEEMSRYIPTAFVILKEEDKDPRFLSYNFMDIVKEEIEFSFEGIAKWANVDDGTIQNDLEKNGKYHNIIEKNDRYFSLGIYDIGTIDQEKYMVLVFGDVTDDIHSKELLEDSMKHADEASKAKTQFLSKMSHEIRTPLNSVIGFSKLSLDNWDKLELDELHDYMNKIQISGNYLLELVSDILDISRIEEGRMEINKSPSSLDVLVDEVANSFYGQMERKRIEFVVDKQYDDVILNMDSFHTKQILNNLVSNAYKYTEEGGVVGLEVVANPIDEKRMSVQFIVQDTGIGMTKEFIAKIFEPFTQEDRGMQMKKQLRGTGLGMSICKNLVELQDGTIKVESELGEGSCFTVQLTYDIMSTGGGEHKVQEEEEQDYSCLKDKKILLVDDIEMNRIVIEKFLQMYGLTYEDAENGQQAVERFEQAAAGEYFAIFMDVRMPVMDGYQATEAIRNLEKENAKTIPIIGMTADAFSDDVNKALLSGMNYHVTKPVQIEKVLYILMEIMKKNS